MCVQGIDAQCVLQFTLIHAAGCALHRLTSRVIHRPEWSYGQHSISQLDVRLLIFDVRAWVFLVATGVGTRMFRPRGGGAPPTETKPSASSGPAGGSLDRRWGKTIFFLAPLEALRRPPRDRYPTVGSRVQISCFAFSLVRLKNRFGNDPSAGSPTETLLRLLLPLSDQV